jgi:ribonucleoside-diphosphate reductase alpha chain
MRVTKRNGTTEVISFDKITRRITKICNKLNITTIDPIPIVQSIITYLVELITTTEIDEITARILMSLSSINPDYQKIAGIIIISNLHKTVKFGKFSDKIKYLYDNDLISDIIYNTVINNKTVFNKMIDYTRDFNIDYFGFKTLERSYLQRIDGKLVECPQDIFMRVSIAMYHDNFSEIEKSYNVLSKKLMTHATPTLFNVGTKRQQAASCFLMTNEDSIEGIYKCLSDSAKISKWAGGIGIGMSDIRASGSDIQGTNGKTTGLIPMLRVFNETARYVNQCITPDAIVYSKDGPKRMDEITTNDSLITHDGSFKKVNEVMTKEKDGIIKEIRINSSLEPIRITKEHLVYIIKKQNKGLNYSVIKNRLDKNILTPEFISADEINEDDLVGFPIPTFTLDMPEVTRDFLKFYGIMLGDGSIYYRRGNVECKVYLGDSKDEIKIFIKKYLFDNGVRFSERYNNGCTCISWSGNGNIRLSRDMIYDLGGEKRIINDFLHLPIDKTLAIIEGLIKTDGSNLKELSFSNSSKQLIYQLRYLLLRCGILTSGYVRNRIGESHISKYNSVITTKKIAYILRIPRHQILETIIDFKTPRKFVRTFVWNGMIWSRIRSIKEIHYSGVVFDFNMEDNHNYLTDFGLVHNSGRRPGSIAVYLEPHHPDFMDFLDIRKSHGDENMRARDLFTAIWISDLFLQRVKENAVWSFLNPHTCPGLSECYGKDYEELYNKYESEGNFMKQLPAVDVWKAIITSQIETGTPYIANKDAVNLMSNQKNIGVIKSSNLCIEIMEYTSPKEYAVCTLGSICLPMMLTDSLEFDFELLRTTVHQMTKNLNRLIDINFYPVPETEYSNMLHRPIGIGMQGLADVFFALRLPYDSEEAMSLNKKIIETMYYSALECSCNLAESLGSYDTFEGSDLHKGIFHFERFTERTGKAVELSGMWDFEALRTRIKAVGIRNSLLIALMPTASTAQVMGNTESFEPVTANIYSRKTLAGDFIVINKFLIKDLIDLGVWSDALKNSIIDNNGSIQHIQGLPQDILNLYKTTWELKQKVLIDLSVARTPFVCQSQSLNLYFKTPTFNIIHSALMYGWKMGLKTMIYYNRSLSVSEAAKFTVSCESCSG